MTHAIGLLHPGEMGATVGAAARLNEVQVVWASAGRGPRTRGRAEEARLTDVGSLPALVEHSRIVLGDARICHCLIPRSGTDHGERDLLSRVESAVNDGTGEAVFAGSGYRLAVGNRYCAEL